MATAKRPFSVTKPVSTPPKPVSSGRPASPPTRTRAPGADEAARPALTAAAAAAGMRPGRAIQPAVRWTEDWGQTRKGGSAAPQGPEEVGRAVRRPAVRLL